MELVELLSSPINSIEIPEGNVIKIEEAVTGRVLWEKQQDDNLSENP